MEHSRLEYDSSRKELASAREAVLKHARKTDGKSDPGLESQEAQAENILASEAKPYSLIMWSSLEIASETFILRLFCQHTTKVSESQVPGTCCFV